MLKRNVFAFFALSALLFGCSPKASSALSSSAASSLSDSEASSLVSSSEAVSSSEVSSSMELYHPDYANPVIVTNPSGTEYKNEIADPSIVRGDDGYLYLFATGRVVLRSDDGVTFTLFSSSIIDRPTWGDSMYPGTSGIEVWAPDCVKVGDQWIYYYALSGWGACCGIGYATADQISGPYTDQGKLFSYSEIGVNNAIDPCLFQEDGHIYMAFGSFQGIYLVQLTDDGMGLEGGVANQKASKTLIAGYPGDWDGSTYEGTYLIHKDDYYYFFGSAGTCCEATGSTYRVYSARSKSLFGPYIDANGGLLTASRNGTTNGSLVVWAGNASTKNVYGPGHNSVLKDDEGNYWMYYHGYHSGDNYATRHLLLDKLLWDKKGFPYVENYVPSFEEDKTGPGFVTI
jgi:arabinan endo-1,5-alpha-L-arabinosidase